MATKHYEEDSQVYTFPVPFTSYTARHLALNHAIEVLKTYGLAETALVYGWGPDTAKIEAFRGRRGNPKSVGVITKCALNEGSSSIQARLTRTYEVR